jgi:hypothetical protein
MLRCNIDALDDFSVWAWEKLRIYALINLYPNILPNPRLGQQNEQPTTKAQAIALLKRLLLDLLSPYIEATADEALGHSAHIAAGRSAQRVYIQELAAVGLELGDERRGDVSIFYPVTTGGRGT